MSTAKELGEQGKAATPAAPAQPREAMARQNAGQQLIAERKLFLKEFGDRAEAPALSDARWEAWVARAVIATRTQAGGVVFSTNPEPPEGTYCVKFGEHRQP